MSKRFIVLHHLGDGVQMRHCYWYEVPKTGAQTIPWGIQSAAMNNEIAKIRQAGSLDARRT